MEFVHNVNDGEVDFALAGGIVARHSVRDVASYSFGFVENHVLPYDGSDGEAAVLCLELNRRKHEKSYHGANFPKQHRSREKVDQHNALLQEENPTQSACPL